MKQFGILLSFVMVMVFISGCNAINTAKYTLLVSVIPDSGGTVKIADTPDGEFDYDSLANSVEIQTNYSHLYNKGTSLTLAAKASEGYVFDSWSGDYSGETDILNVAMNNNISIAAHFRVSVTNPEEPDDDIPGMPPDEQGIVVQTTTLLVPTSLSPGETLIIFSQIEYVGEEPSIEGIPVVSIMDANADVVAAWYLDEDGNTQSGSDDIPRDIYPIARDTMSTIQISWDLSNFFTHESVPNGEYTVQASIYSLDTDNLLPTNEAAQTITISGDPVVPPPQNQEVQVNAETSLSSSQLIIGDTLTIHSVVEMITISEDTQLQGAPVIQITDSSGMVYARWYLDENGNMLTELEFGDNFYQIEDTPYIMDVSWQLIIPTLLMYVQPGEYFVQASIFTHPADVLLLTNEGDMPISITSNPEEEVEVTAYPNFSINSQDDFNLSEISLTTGDTLTIHTDIEYTGDEPGFWGAPVIQISNSAGEVVAQWYLDQGNNVVTGLEFAEEFYNIVDDLHYIMDVTWNMALLNTESIVPPGVYKLQITIFSSEADRFLTVLEGVYFILISE